MTKIVEKKLPVGKWRITLVSETAGHTITGVNLKGLRNRPWPIRQASQEEFFERHPKDENGEPSDTIPSLRGMPSLWTSRGNQIYLWPSPSQEWTVQIELTPK